MAIWVLTSDRMPTICIKAETQEEAVERLKQGLSETGKLLSVLEPSFMVRELTIPLLEEVTEGWDEFKLDQETGF
jgi:hypothetical protein